MEAIWLYQFRLIVIGDSTVGKSCLIRRFTEGRFAQVSDPTVGVDFFSRLVEIEPGKRIKLQIWDTAGQERFRSITRAYYRNSVGGLLLFDITNRRSFQNVHEWLEETKVHVQPYQIVFVLETGGIRTRGDLNEMEQKREFYMYWFCMPRVEATV
ncbi:ras-related protein Rab-39B-like [Mauremys mutica]|uniref:ras-related protein Rab-39B-like n=1 Tax=Mauremys mutica TaxID=74926 RepID=UPI001D1648B0|nr:ras-related protein Rab-39B-like [Mauremys mutica]